MCQQPWRHNQCQQGRAEAGDAGALLQPGGEAGQRNPGCQCPHLPFAVCVALPCVCAPASCTCITNTRLWKNQFGKELRGLSTLHFSSEREISPESVWVWCSGGFYLQTLPVLTLSPAGPSAEAAWAESEPCITGLPGVQGTSLLSLGSTACKFGKDLLCLLAYRNFTGSHIIQTWS